MDYITVQYNTIQYNTKLMHCSINYLPKNVEMWKRKVGENL